MHANIKSGEEKTMYQLCECITKIILTDKAPEGFLKELAQYNIPENTKCGQGRQ